MPRVDASAELVRRTPSNRGINRMLQRLTDGAVKVGVLTGTGTYPSGTNAPLIAEIAFWNEYGTDMIPERPFARNTVFERGREWLQVIRVLLRKRANDEISEDDALGFLGEVAKADMQQTITDFSVPPNAPLTIAIKGVDNPLIDQGILRSSIQWLILRAGER